MNQDRRDIAEEKVMYEHQLSEFRKHLSQLELENQTYKEQLQLQSQEIQALK